MQVSQSREGDRSPRVLVVEEDARKREQFRRAFARRGYTVEAAQDESEALAKVRQIPFEVALLSAHMAGVADEKALTRAESVKTRLLRIRPEMVTLVLNQRSYLRAAMPARRMISLTERVLRERELAARDRRLAQRLEDTLLPQPFASLPEFDIACIYEPATEEDGLGGDFFDFFTLPSGRLGILLGDVAGRGLEAAPFTAMARYFARAYAHQRESAAWVLGETNTALERDTPEELFVTLFFGILDPPSRQLLWASAGHDAPLLLLPGRSEPALLWPTGSALGILPSATYFEQSVTLPPGSLLLLYTDGVTDPWARHGEWETTPLQCLLRAGTEQSATEISAAIMAAMHAEAGGSRTDDASLIVIRGR